MTPDRTAPGMYAASSASLVSRLSHPNGWWRDTAQKLLVLRQDKSVVPTLKTMAQSSATGQLARMHALWTLEGLGSLDAVLVRGLMKDVDPQIRIHAIRASESLYKGTPGDKRFAADYRALATDSDPNVAIQALLTLNGQRVPQACGTTTRQWSGGLHAANVTGWIQLECRGGSKGRGESPTTVIALARPAQAKFVRITQTGTAAAGEFWALQQVRLYHMPAAR